MKQHFLFIGLILLTLSMCGKNGQQETQYDDIDMKIILENIEHSTIIYDGRYNRSIFAKIENAAPTNNPAKEAIHEGAYIVEFSTGERYRIQSNDWVSDENKDRILRCSILANLRGYLLDYLKNTGLEVPY